MGPRGGGLGLEDTGFMCFGGLGSFVGGDRGGDAITGEAFFRTFAIGDGRSGIDSITAFFYSSLRKSNLYFSK